MDAKPDELHIAENLQALIDKEELSVNAWSKKYKLEQSTVRRVIEGEMAPTIKMLLKITAALRAKGVRLQAWQLLAPALGEAYRSAEITEGGKTRTVLILRERDNVGAPAPATGPNAGLSRRADSGHRPQSNPWGSTKEATQEDERKKGAE